MILLAKTSIMTSRLADSIHPAGDPGPFLCAIVPSVGILGPVFSSGGSEMGTFLDENASHNRRDFLKTAGAAALATNLFTGRVRGANDRVSIGFIGLGAMGSGNLGYAMKVPEFQPAAVCDVYQPHLERAEAAARKRGFQVKAVKDFREIIADKSIDAVCISTPDHWHAYMTVEACKAGKDVYVEKPACVYVEEGQKMVQAARKYKRVVQAGTMQRSGGYFQKAAEIVKSGEPGRDHLLPRLAVRPGQAGRRRQSAGRQPSRGAWIGRCGWGRRPKCRST